MTVCSIKDAAAAAAADAAVVLVFLAFKQKWAMFIVL